METVLWEHDTFLREVNSCKRALAIRNSRLAGIPSYLLDRLQSMMNVNYIG